jgi:hypothetical protein
VYDRRPLRHPLKIGMGTTSTNLWITRFRPDAVKLDRYEVTTGPQPVSATRAAEHDHRVEPVSTTRERFHPP